MPETPWLVVRLEASLYDNDPIPDFQLISELSDFWLGLAWRGPSTTDLRGIRNDRNSELRPDIVSSTYWRSEQAANGKTFVLYNAGAVRVLLPPAQEHLIAEMRAAGEVVVSIGPWPQMSHLIGLEFLRADGRDSPFCLLLGPDSFDMVPPETPPAPDRVCSVWIERNGAPQRELMHVCHWRRVPEIPWLTT
jgi:hypothetical protein